MVSNRIKGLLIALAAVAFAAVQGSWPWGP